MYNSSLSPAMPAPSPGAPTSPLTPTTPPATAPATSTPPVATVAPQSQPPPQQQLKKNLSLTVGGRGQGDDTAVVGKSCGQVLTLLNPQREQMFAAQEMFKTANKVTRPEKALILGFMAGSRGGSPKHLGGVGETGPNGQWAGPSTCLATPTLCREPLPGAG